MKARKKCDFLILNCTGFDKFFYNKDSKSLKNPAKRSPLEDITL